MKSFPPELLIVLFFLAVTFVQILLKVMRSRRPSPPESAQDETHLADLQPAWEGAQAPSPSPARSSPSVSEIRFGRSAVATASIPPPSGRFARRSLMGDRRAMQNAIVIAAIVGPCRALEPLDIR
jgi:hypothetical protein